MKKSYPLLAGLSICLLFGCSESAAPGTDQGHQDEVVARTPVTEELLAEGREGWILWCANCHGTEGHGDGPDAVMLDPKPRDQTDREYMDQLTDTEIAETIVYGGAPRGYPNMPAISQLWGQELVALVAYVRNLSHPGVESVALTADSPL